VLVQVPRRGYLPSVACAECRTPAACPHCSGPLGLRRRRRVPACRGAGGRRRYDLPALRRARLRAVGARRRRTAEELGRAFPGTPVRTSGRDGCSTRVPASRRVVVATPGAEPVADGGYGAVAAARHLGPADPADLRAGEETLRRG
jgi:primosomal protein N' (replication factor Y)